VYYGLYQLNESFRHYQVDSVVNVRVSAVLFVDNETTITGLSKSSAFSRVTFTFHMRRRPLYYIVNLIIPCGLLSLIAVLSFLLPANCTERLGLSTYYVLQGAAKNPRRNLHFIKNDLIVYDFCKSQVAS